MVVYPISKIFQVTKKNGDLDKVDLIMDNKDRVNLSMGVDMDMDIEDMDTGDVQALLNL